MVWKNYWRAAILRFFCSQEPSIPLKVIESLKELVFVGSISWCAGVSLSWFVGADSKFSDIRLLVCNWLGWGAYTVKWMNAINQSFSSSFGELVVKHLLAHHLLLHPSIFTMLDIKNLRNFKVQVSTLSINRQSDYVITHSIAPGKLCCACKTESEKTWHFHATVNIVLSSGTPERALGTHRSLQTNLWMLLFIEKLTSPKRDLN